MAIIFSSITETRKKVTLKIMFIAGAVSFFTLFTVLLLFFTYSYPPTYRKVETFSEAKFNAMVLDSEILRSLDKFSLVKVRFRYTARDQLNRLVSGEVLSYSADEAQRSLQQIGITVLSIQEAPVGRNNPFQVYYPI